MWMSAKKAMVDVSTSAPIHWGATRVHVEMGLQCMRTYTDAKSVSKVLAM